MQPHSTTTDAPPRRHRPRMFTVIAAAFAAGVVLAYGVDRVVDVHIVQVEPQVESEPIFVALRSMPQGSPITVWDVALKDWPKAMLPTTALKADASFEGMVLRHPIREGQPLLSVQLVRDGGPLPGATVAAAVPASLPPVSGSWTAATVLSPTVAVQPPENGERFVPATPADPPVATAEPAPPLASPTQPAAEPVTPSTEAVAVITVPVPPTTQVVDADIEAVTDPATTADVPAPFDAAAAVAAVEPLPAPAGAADAAPAAIVATDSPSAVPTPAANDVAAFGNTVPDMEPAPRLAAPVPALPTTDIERSLATFGRQQSKPAEERSASVLDRTTEDPAPSPVQTAPRYHLVVPERVALAVDASFTQRPAPATTPAEMPAAQAVASSPSEPAATRAAASGAGKTAPGTRQSTAAKAGTSSATRPSPKPAAKANVKQSGKPQSTPARGMSAWFPQFSTGTRQR